MGTLSVRENLAFSAALRLPTSVSKQERDEKVESVIAELGLSHVATSMVICTFYNSTHTQTHTHARTHARTHYTCVF